MAPQRATGVLLAAGAGTRLGLGPKALLIHQGRPLVETIAASLFEGGCHDVVIVLGAGASMVMDKAKLDPYRIVVNDNWASGMGSSYLVGAAAASPRNDLMLALVDQPGLNARIVSRLLMTHRPGRITSAAYAHPDQQGTLRRGHPLIIDAKLRDAVSSTVSGDAGARAFLRDNPRLVDQIDCSDQSTGEDIDTVEQMRRLL
ncbi:nicotine blue oxidoreductase [Glutamicibacter nicotianae]|uniref:4-diphosphocytidyl-2C-methyl-D-erythritol synthase n=1 Tax=Glutamicibacter nicotianae TaxID=37929 RepID=A0ABQ0RQA1_GLUNI|nr:nucleotidyltransferase family protein [Glutamicibacter nicotianae]GEC14003.1 4-diphosphocytidyl-2C-methyl-D-erythritol synthase [Glutamicibacter nicotianae]